LDFSRRGAAEHTALIIPSLINRYHILDIDKGASFARSLAQKNIRTLLVDWGNPSTHENAFTLDDYFSDRLMPILEYMAELSGGAVSVVGYCMGGTMAVALAQLMPLYVKNLTCLATPWDFHGGDPAMGVKALTLLAMLEPHLEAWGYLPVDVLQSFFILQHPFNVHDKFVRFAAEQDPHAARIFTLVEDWLNDGVPLPRHVAHTCLKEWYGENRTMQGIWQVLGKDIMPQRLDIPSLHVIPRRDKIVPPANALALAKIMKNAKIIHPAAGHISMMVHAAARDEVWPQIADWLVTAR
jgi:polyhydroxyalkanoate synthase